MKTTVNIEELMKDLDLTEMGVSLDPAPVDAGQVMDDLTRQGVLTAGPQRGKPRPIRFAVRAAVAAALVLTLSVTAWAVGNYTDFFDAFFGTAPAPAAMQPADDGTINVNSRQETYTDDVTGSVATYTVPGYQLVQIDEQEADRLLGPYVTVPENTWSVDGYTVQLLGYIQDEAGSSRLYYSIENPDGLGNIATWDQNGYTAAGPADQTKFRVMCYGQALYVDTAKSTDTKIYLCAPEVVGPHDDGTRLAVLDDSGTLVEQLDVKADSLVPALTARGEDFQIMLSPMGARVTTLGLKNLYPDESYFSITMTDGSEYTVFSAGEEIDNTSYSCGFEPDSPYGASTIHCFNRIIDPAQVASVTVTGVVQTEAGSDPTYITETIEF